MSAVDYSDLFLTCFNIFKMFFVLKLCFTKEVNTVKKIQGLGHPTAPGRYMIESGHFYGLSAVYLGKEPVRMLWKYEKYLPLPGIKRQFSIRPASLVTVLTDLTRSALII